MRARFWRRRNQQLDSEFDLVMIQEYFDESLLLLRKMFCWEMDDIVYLAKAVQSQNLRIKLTDDLRKKISSWNHADVLLYKHFNAPFWRKLEDYGQTLQSDLALFRSKLTGAVGTWSEWFNMLERGEVEYTSLIRRRMVNCGIPLNKMDESLT